MDNSNFEQLLKVNKMITTELRNEIIAILKREKTITQVCEDHRQDANFPKDIKGIKRRMQILINTDQEVRTLYEEYIKKKNSKPRGYDYIPEILYMLSNDLSQRRVAEVYGISRNTIKTAIERIEDGELRQLIKVHSDRHSLGKDCPTITKEEKDNILKYIQKRELEKQEQVKNKELEDSDEREQ